MRRARTKSAPCYARRCAKPMRTSGSTATKTTSAPWFAQADLALRSGGRMDSIDMGKRRAVSHPDSDTSLDHAARPCDAGQASIIEDINETSQLLTLDLPVAPTVLIVDDDELVLARLQELVAAAGYSVRTAASGNEALT